MRPTTTEIELPLLFEIYRAGGFNLYREIEKRDKIFQEVARYFPNMAAHDQTELKPSSDTTTLWENQVHGARNQLVQKGQMKHPSEIGQGYWQITESGVERLMSEMHVLSEYFR